MHKKLSQIANITSGHAFRGAIRPDSQGDTFVFQAKNLIQDIPFIDINTLVKTTLNSPKPSSYLKKDDIVIVARGLKEGAFRSTIINVDVNNLIASSSIHIIRITTQDVIPTYFSQYLNSPVGQRSLLQIVIGAYIGAISRKKLENITVPTPSLAKQKLIVNLYNNIHKQQGLVTAQMQNKQSIINNIFRSMATS